MTSDPVGSFRMISPFQEMGLTGKAGFLLRSGKMKGRRDVRVHDGHAVCALVSLWVSVPTASKDHFPGEPTEVPRSGKCSRGGLPLGFGFENRPTSMPPSSRAEKPARCGKEEDFSVQTLLCPSSNAENVDSARARREGGAQCAGSSAASRHGTMPVPDCQQVPVTKPEKLTVPVSCTDSRSCCAHRK